MLKVNIEQLLNKQDQSIISAFKNTIKRYNDNNINQFWQEVKNCNFDDHLIGKGGNHVWITRKVDNVRIATVTE